MYRHLKRLLALLAFLFVAGLGFLFVQTSQSEMLAGFREVVTIEQSTVGIDQKLETLAKENHLVLARRIVATTDQGKGGIENTYTPIGSDRLPSSLKRQTDPQLIKNAGYNTLYIIVSGKLSAEEVAEKLSSQGNEALVFPTEYSTVLLRLFLTNRQIWMIIIAWVVAYMTLVLAEYISDMRTVGIRRLSGEGKHQIALMKTVRDTVFMVLSALIIIVGVSLVMLAAGLWSLTGLLLVALPIAAICLLFVMVNAGLSNLFYYALQKQPIYLSIKGKAPVAIIMTVVLATQAVAIASVMYCFFGMTRIDKDLSLLETGQKVWQENKAYYSLATLEGSETVTQEDYRSFYEELEKSVTILYRESNSDDIAISDSSEAGSYEPTEESISNVLYVNPAFINHSDLSLSPESEDKLNSMKESDELILIPQSQKNNYSSLKKQWTRFEKHGFASNEVSQIAKGAEVLAGLYDGGAVFTYPIFDDSGGTQSISVDSFRKDPIIIVRKVDMTDSLVDPGDMLVDHPETVISLIQKYKMTTEFGNLTNGFESIQAKEAAYKQDKNLLLIAVGVSLATSFMLMILVNIIYFYQGRREFFIKRLAGMSLLSMHRTYLLSLSLGALVMYIGALFLNLPGSVTLVPLVYLFVAVGLFSVQLHHENHSNISYLKGE